MKSMHERYFQLNNRLALYKSWGNTPEDWQSKWDGRSITNLFNKHKNGELGEFEIFSNYLSNKLPVLEAGCGMGQLVLALSARGYQVSGVDYSAPTINRILSHAPELDVRVGDVSQLDVPDEFYGGYISLGVVEHYFQGPRIILREAKRVLSRDGYAFFSTPFLNRERIKILASVPTVADVQANNHLQFYQYYFTREEFSDLLQQSGLNVIDYWPYAVYAGLTRDFSTGRWLAQHRFFSWRIRKIIASRCQNAPHRMRWRFAHMLMYICKPI